MTERDEIRFLALFEDGFTRIYGPPSQALRDAVSPWGHFVEVRAAYRR